MGREKEIDHVPEEKLLALSFTHPAGEDPKGDVIGKKREEMKKERKPKANRALNKIFNGDHRDEGIDVRLEVSNENF